MLHKQPTVLEAGGIGPSLTVPLSFLTCSTSIPLAGANEIIPTYLVPERIEQLGSKLSPDACTVDMLHRLHYQEFSEGVGAVRVVFRSYTEICILPIYRGCQIIQN